MEIDINKLPQHVAIVMDGNGRWAKKRMQNRLFGHKHGVKTVRTVIETSARLGIKYLTLFTFSMENWSRPKNEIKALLELLISSLNSELSDLKKNKIKIEVIGNLDMFPLSIQKAIEKAVQETQHGDKMTVVLALSYGAQHDISNAVKNISLKIAKKELHADDIDLECVRAHLSTAKYPYPELLIRTSGEYRISNFLLWELAYTELYFCKKNWPEFEEEDYLIALKDFQERERRFGKVSEQL
jgi:undecaprenyl diphosphate synthase